MKTVRIFVPILIGLALCFYVIGCGSVTGGGGGGGGTPTEPPFSAEVWVSTTGSDDAGDGSFDNPFATIRAGLDKATSEGKTIVGVMPGVYPISDTILWNLNGGILIGVSPETTTIDASSCTTPAFEFSSITGMNTIENVTIKGTSAGGWWGGAIRVVSSSDIYLKFKNVIFNENTSSYGGAIFISSGTVEAENCMFHDNTATNIGGAVQLSEGTFIAKMCTFEGNDVTGGYLWGGAISLPYAGTSGGMLRLERCAFYGNQANNGGAIGHYNKDDNMTGRIENCIFSYNDAHQRGGAIHLTSAATIEVVNCTIVSNEAVTSGGGIRGSSATKVINCIIYGNDASTDDEIDSATTPEVTYSDVKGGYAGTGNANADPRFISITDFHFNYNALGVVFNGGTMEAAPSVDYDGNIRPDSLRPDPNQCSMGAYEFYISPP